MLRYFSVRIRIAGRIRDLKGVRAYATDNLDTVYGIVKKELLKFYLKTDILRIDIWELPEYCEEVKDYKRKAGIG